MTTEYRERLRTICESLPEVAIDYEGEPHLIFRVRRKTFAYYLEDHHGDGEVAMACKVEPGMNEALIQSDPERYFMPAYVGPRGWVAARLDRPDADWNEIADLIAMSYTLVAPKSLARLIHREGDQVS